MRIGNVIEPQEYATLFPGFFANPKVRLRYAFCYIDARDLGQIVGLCLKKNALGFQVFNADHDDNPVNLTAEEILNRFYPGVPLVRPLGEREALFSDRKIREVLGFRAQHSWNRHVKP